MSSLVTYPDATLTTNRATVTGAATAHAALSDSLDSSYVVLASDYSSGFTVDEAHAKVGFAEPAVPAGGVLISASLYARYKRTAGSISAASLLYLDGDGGDAVGAGVTTPGSSIRTDLVVLLASSTPASNLVAKISTNGSTTIDEEYGSGLGDSGSGSFSGTGTIRLYELSLLSIFAIKPTLTVNAPTGTVDDTNLPRVSWTASLDGDGGAQTRYEVKIFTAAQYGAGGFNPATSDAYQSTGIVSSSAASYRATESVANGTYKAYVRVGQTINGAAHLSDWTAGDAFTVDVALPAAPLVTATADDENARIYVTVVHQAGDAEPNFVELQRSIDNGETWAVVRSTDPDFTGVTFGQDHATYDYEVPNGVPVLYRARSIAISIDGERATSPWTTSTAATWTSRSWWIKDPYDPSKNLAVEVHSQPDRIRTARQGIFQPLGASAAVVVSDTRAAPTGTITLRVDTAADQASLDALLDVGNALLVQAPLADYWPDRYVRFLDQSRTRIADKAFIESVFDALPWVQVGEPTGPLIGFPDSLLPSTDLLPSTTLYPAL